MNIFQPYYDFCVNQPFVFFENYPIEVNFDGFSLFGTSKIVLEFFPEVGVYIYGQFNQSVEGEENTLHVAGKALLAEKISTSFEAKVGKEINYGAKWRIVQEVKNDKNLSLKKVIAHLFNFTDFQSIHFNVGEKLGYKFRMNFFESRFEDWIITVSALVDTHETVESINENKGYGLTHVVSLAKSQSAGFTPLEASELLTSLDQCLSFINGRWCHTICPIGFDKDNEAIWGEWSAPSIPWDLHGNWFDEYTYDQLEELFPKFLHKIKDPKLGEALQGVLPWYLSANDFSKGVELNIIATQTALEKLSYEYVVNYKRLLTKNGFKDLWASDKFRLLFSSLSIPIDITNETPKIFNIQHQKNFNWLDAPHALTEMRNAIVHPEHAKKKLIDELLIEAWHLGLRYLELAILAICDYQGTYANRLIRNRWAGHVEKVPWAK